ncbi:DUF3152 domain-containing protein [Micromonospora inyonensis]|uniref:DUF3152 domain-containing protein n=1 Tax=Micromonospora inyonensis TaxID=47866 RepID=UPI000B833955|nr:DUF3152 domain-containing protein [Micromonospora inyonensis]
MRPSAASDRPGPRRRVRPVALAALLVAGVATLVLVRSATPTVPGTVAPTGGAGAYSGPGTGAHGPVPEPPSETDGQRSDAPVERGSGRFVAVAGGSPVAGTGGPLHRYRVGVEAGTGQDPTAFAAAVDATLSDPRSWIASGELRVQRVAGAEAADFTVYLATSFTSERMCAEGGLHTAGYTSCRLPGKVIINLDRWLTAVPDYAAPLAVYRAYVINHEVGHEFGELHEACPGPGRPAPVMQQQTYGLTGCVANAWPYLDGRRYAGDLVP